FEAKFESGTVGTTHSTTITFPVTGSES
ncbi:hypothetical protein A2U01_0118641, partial [Trifolium medium]|nr:hypothetical protein [Trifolium medium]